MRTVVLISCVKSKRPERARARDLYTSDLFRKQLHFAESLRPDAIYILSAKYGLLPLEQEVDPYELTLKGMAAADKRRWATGVLQQLSSRANLQADRFIILAGAEYARPLLPHLAHVELPLDGLSIGRRLQFLTKHQGGKDA